MDTCIGGRAVRPCFHVAYQGASFLRGTHAHARKDVSWGFRALLGRGVVIETSARAGFQEIREKPLVQAEGWWKMRRRGEMARCVTPARGLDPLLLIREKPLVQIEGG